MSATVKIAVKEHQKFIDEGTRLIRDYQLTKFDRLQFSRALQDASKLAEVSTDLQQKIFGPDFQTKAIQIQYSLTKKLAQVNLVQFSLYVQATQPAFLEMFQALQEKVNTLIDSLLQLPPEEV